MEEKLTTKTLEDKVREIWLSFFQGKIQTDERDQKFAVLFERARNDGLGVYIDEPDPKTGLFLVASIRDQVRTSVRFLSKVKVA